MTDVAIMETCCYCGRRLPQHSLIYNESKGVYYCADSDECNAAQKQSGSGTYTDTNGGYRRTVHPNLRFHYRQSN